MIDLGLNQYKVKEIRYEVKEGKTVIFKLNNFNLEDVEIEGDKKECCNKSCTCQTKTVYDGNVADSIRAIDRQIIDEHIEAENKKIKSRFDALALDKSKELINKTKDIPYKVMENVGTLYTFNDGEGKFETKQDPYVANDERETAKQGIINRSRGKTIEDLRQELKEAYEKERKESNFSIKDLNKFGPAKHLNDYEPISCLKEEKGMQETLESSRKKEWKEDVITKPSKPTPTGNALIKEDCSELKESVTGYKNKKNYTQSNLAEPEEIKVFNINQKISDSKYIEEENKE